MSDSAEPQQLSNLLARHDMPTGRSLKGLLPICTCASCLWDCLCPKERTASCPLLVISQCTSRPHLANMSRCTPSASPLMCTELAKHVRSEGRAEPVKTLRSVTVVYWDYDHLACSLELAYPPPPVDPAILVTSHRFLLISGGSPCALPWQPASVDGTCSIVAIGWLPFVFGMPSPARHPQYFTKLRLLVWTTLITSFKWHVDLSGYSKNDHGTVQSSHTMYELATRCCHCTRACENLISGPSTRWVML